jgi:anaerobic magnesium-protoporphyrin IX monomethyl ester cyclase
MARALLVNPPFYRLLGSHYNANSLGIAYIAAVLNSNGHDAWLYNADYLNRNSYIKLKGLFDGFADYTTYFKDENHPIWQEVVQKIIDFKPDWVGYTSYTANVSTIDIISRNLKKRNPNIKQVIGGVHATLDPFVLDKLVALDYSVKREGEYAMLALMDGKDPAQISGVISRGAKGGLHSNGDAEVIKDIDLLPFPERDKFWNLSEEDKKFVDVSYVCTIRGCPYRCTYCASPQHWKRDRTQYRSPESVLTEMIYIKKNFWDTQKKYDFSASANTGAKSELLIEDNTIVYFVDDVFTVKKKRVKEILQGIINEGLNMDWKCECRTDHLDEEICDLMRKSNCKRVKIGFETGSPHILKMIKKDETREDMLKGAKMLKNAHVPFTAYFMVGFPDETDDDVRETIKFAKEIKADYYSLSILAPYYGTKIYYDLIDSGIELDKKPWEYFYHQTGEMMANTKISPKVLQEFLELHEWNKEGEGYA